MKKINLNLLLIISVLFCSFPMFADEQFNFWGSGETFKLNTKTDGILLGTGSLLTGSSLLFEYKIDKITKPSAAVLDENNVNPLDRLFINAYSKPLDTAADVVLYAGLMAPGFLLACNPTSEWSTLAIMYGESLLFAEGIHRLLKCSVKRPRPYMYRTGYPEEVINNNDWSKSFPSGHTTRIFAAAAFSSYVFCKYYPDSNWKYVVIGTSYAIACTTAALRIASGNHFVTDVLAGAVLGTLCGIGIPALHTLNTNAKKTDGSQDRAVTITPVGFNVCLKL